MFEVPEDPKFDEQKYYNEQKLYAERRAIKYRIRLNAYIEEGFTREEAIRLIISENEDI